MMYTKDFVGDWAAQNTTLLDGISFTINKNGLRLLVS